MMMNGGMRGDLMERVKLTCERLLIIGGLITQTAAAVTAASKSRAGH